jgi:hypothetical protein
VVLAPGALRLRVAVLPSRVAKLAKGACRYADACEPMLR